MGDRVAMDSHVLHGCDDCSPVIWRELHDELLDGGTARSCAKIAPPTSGSVLRSRHGPCGWLVPLNVSTAC